MSGNENVKVIGINSGEKKQTVENFIKESGIDYPVLYGTKSVMSDYNITGIPAFFIINQKGEIVKQFSGYRNGLEKEWYTEIEALLK